MGQKSGTIGQLLGVLKVMGVRVQHYGRVCEDVRLGARVFVSPNA